MFKLSIQTKYKVKNRDRLNDEVKFLLSIGEIGFTMDDRSISDGEFTKIFADHRFLNVHYSEYFTIVNTDTGTNHFGENNHVSKVGLHNSRRFTRGSVLEGCLDLGHQTNVRPRETSTKPPTLTGRQKIKKLVVLKGKKIFSKLTSIGKLTDRSSSFFGLNMRDRKEKEQEYS